MGQEVRAVESMEYSADLIEKICKTEGIDLGQLVLHADNGGPMKGATMLARLEKLGVAASFSRPRVSNDNPYSESLFKTLKYRPEYPSKPFSDLAAAQDWINKFVNWYNNDHLHSGIKFISPNDRHDFKDDEILRKRKAVYEEAKLKNKNRWSGETRNWEKVDKVYLNHLPNKRSLDIKNAA